MNVSPDWTVAERLLLILRISNTEREAPGTRAQTMRAWWAVGMLASAAPSRLLQDLRAEILEVAQLKEER